MQRIATLVVLCLLVMTTCALAGDAPCTERYGKGEQALRLATGSPGELGLVGALGEAWSARSGMALCWRKAGTGDALAALKAGEVDMVMVHGPKAEKKAVEEGWATGRALVGSNEFFIVGPVADPAGIAKATDAADAYRRIAKAGALFFSRGDNSGTHKKELDIWASAGITPSGAWYTVHKGFMSATLQRADAEGGYFMTDSSTWVAEKGKLKHLAVLFRGDPVLINVYHALLRAEGGKAAVPAAVDFAAFVTSPEGQDIVGSFGRKEYGEGLYNDAAYAKKYDH